MGIPGAMAMVESGAVGYTANILKNSSYAAGGADAIYQLASKDIKDFNVFEVGAYMTAKGNLFTASFLPALGSSTINLSYNSVFGEDKIFSNPFTTSNATTILANTLGGMVGGKLFQLSRPVRFGEFGYNFFGSYFGGVLYTAPKANSHDPK